MRLFQRQPRSGVLFVCMGNICRSPTAEGVFRQMVKEAGLHRRIDVDSAGTHAHHVRYPPDPRATAAAAKRGYDLGRIRARQVSEDDFARFDYILAMDQRNLKVLESLRPPGHAGHLGLLMDFAPGASHREVPDPYYGAAEGFELVLNLVEEAGAGLLRELRTKLPGS